jgi:O-antigen ligase
VAAEATANLSARKSSHNDVKWRGVGRRAAYIALSACLAVVVVIHGGVDPLMWQRVAFVIALASLACLALRSRRPQGSALSLEEYLLAALAAWMVFALIPLPPAIVRILSPQRARLAEAARAFAGAEAIRWIPLSAAPAATLERLQFVLPAMAVFIAAREMPRWWNGRAAWVAVAPVIAVATLEAGLGLSRVYTADGAAGLRSASGTYVNRNHFAGLLELAFPLALAWAAALWTRPRRSARLSSRDAEPSTGIVLGTSTLLVAAACLLAGVIASVSRMGFAATLTAMAIVTSGWLVLRQRRRPTSAWLWAMPFVLVPAIVVLGSTDMMALRLGELLGSNDGLTDVGRLSIWKEGWQLARTYPLTGSGLGTFEHALYPFRFWMPVAAVDFAHNDFLQILAELGVVGFALAMALAVCIVKQAMSLWLQPGSRYPWLGLGLLGAFAATGLHSVVDFNLYIPANALAMAWLAGVAVSPGLRETTA